MSEKFLDCSDIACQRYEIGVILTANGFISVLKKMTVSLMPAVIIDHNLPHVLV